MATTNKDFVVKNGLRVATGVIFGDSTTQTTAYDHTKNIVPSGTSFPGSAVTGQLFFKTDTGKLHIYFNGWLELAYVGGPSPDLFIDGGSPSTAIFNNTYDGGTPSTTVFNQTIDGGNP